MNNNWQVRINQEGNLYIHGKTSTTNLMDLFGNAKSEHGICVYSYYLRSVRQLLSKLFPNNAITSVDAIESVIKEEFCETRSVSIFKSILEKADIPYISYDSAA